MCMNGLNVLMSSCEVCLEYLGIKQPTVCRGGLCVTFYAFVLQASATSSPGPASLGSQVHAAAVNGDRSALLKLITGIGNQFLNALQV